MIASLEDFNPIYETYHKLNDSTRDIQSFLNQAIQFVNRYNENYHRNKKTNHKRNCSVRC